MDITRMNVLLAMLAALVWVGEGYHRTAAPPTPCNNPIDHCSACYDTGLYCTSCGTGQYYLDDGNCGNSYVSNCANYSQADGARTCTVCDTEYTLFHTYNPTEEQCISCRSYIDSRCSSCHTDESTGTPLCDTCDAYYALETGGYRCRACPSNCDACHYDGTTTTDDVLCDTCRTGYTLSADQTQCRACPSNCYNCTETSGDVLCDVGNCHAGYALKQDRTGCLACSIISNCEECTDTNNGLSPDTCTNCASGYGVKHDSTECIPCDEANCVECTDSNSTMPNAETCTACEGYMSRSFGTRYYGYTLAQGGVNDGTCLQCADNCEVCSDRDSNSVAICSQCASGYTLSTNQQSCIACSTLDAQCTSCTVNSTDDVISCQACSSSSYALKANNLGCTACPSQCTGTCTDSNSDNTPECTACSDYYGLVNSNSACQLCSSSANLRMDQCKTCSSSNQDGTLDRCSECNTGYQTKGDNTGCLECRDHLPGCQTCAASAGGDNINTCSVCESGYALKGNAQGCTACNRIENCLTCTDTDSNGVPECTSCSGSYVPSSDGSYCTPGCTTIHSACETCFQPETHCTACDEGYVLSSDQRSCTPGCYECSNTTGCAKHDDEESLLSEGYCNLASASHGCWVYLMTDSSGEFFQRACGNTTCPTSDDVICENVVVNGENVERCGKCCQGHLCNKYETERPSGSDKVTPLSMISMLLTVAITTVTSH